MKLKSIKYSEFLGADNEWTLSPLDLGDNNLLVGKNASGKTRTLNLINGLARLLSGRQKDLFTAGCHEATYETENGKMKYILELEDKKVKREQLWAERKSLLKRGSDGAGRIHAEKMEKHIEFQTPVEQLAAVARQDSIQHSFFQPLYQWGDSVY